MAANSSSLARRLPLPNGSSIPQIHLGVYMMTGREAHRATQYALAAGYRGIDSAQMYGNEKEVGKAILDFINGKSNPQGLKREDIYYTSKLSSNASYEVARQSIKNSVKVSGLGYIDLFLLHSPYGGKAKRLASWKAVEDAIEAGEVKTGGVSNYGVHHLEEMMEANYKPAINQIEVHPFNTNTNITEFCEKHGILVEAWGPLARAMRMNHPVIVELSKKYSRTPAQLMIRWSLQHGYIPLPKSVSKERIVANAEVDDFDIDAEDMNALDGLDEHLVTDWDPTDTA